MQLIYGLHLFLKKWQKRKKNAKQFTLVKQIVGPQI